MEFSVYRICIYFCTERLHSLNFRLKAEICSKWKNNPTIQQLYLIRTERLMGTSEEERKIECVFLYTMCK